MANTHHLGTGRRKRAVARVRLTQGKGQIIVNGDAIEKYFPSDIVRRQALEPLQVTDLSDKLNISVNVCGGGSTGQAGAIRHGISRALLSYDASLRATLKPKGFLTRDSRKVESKKYGLHKARKATQFSKR